MTVCRYLEKKQDSKYTCEELLYTLQATNFAGIQEQGFIPLYRRENGGFDMPPVTDENEIILTEGIADDFTLSNGRQETIRMLES